MVSARDGLYWAETDAQGSSLRFRTFDGRSDSSIAVEDPATSMTSATDRLGVWFSSPDGSISHWVAGGTLTEADWLRPVPQLLEVASGNLLVTIAPTEASYHLYDVPEQRQIASFHRAVNATGVGYVGFGDWGGVLMGAESDFRTNSTTVYGVKEKGAGAVKWFVTNWTRPAVIFGRDLNVSVYASTDYRFHVYLKGAWVEEVIYLPIRSVSYGHGLAAASYRDGEAFGIRIYDADRKCRIHQHDLESTPPSQVDLVPHGFAFTQNLLKGGSSLHVTSLAGQGCVAGLSH